MYVFNPITIHDDAILSRVLGQLAVDDLLQHLYLAVVRDNTIPDVGLHSGLSYHAYLARLYVYDRHEPWLPS
jgi:hypothetical protein